MVPVTILLEGMNVTAVTVIHCGLATKQKISYQIQAKPVMMIGISNMSTIPVSVSCNTIIPCVIIRCVYTIRNCQYLFVIHSSYVHLIFVFIFISKNVHHFMVNFFYKNVKKSVQIQKHILITFGIKEINPCTVYCKN